MNPIKSFINRFRSEEDGIVLTEIALSMPLYLILLAGIFEVGNYLILHMKVQHTVVTIADLVTRDEEISESVMSDIFQVVPHIISPYPAGADSVTIVTAVSQTKDIPTTVFWQRKGGGTFPATSEFGEEGDAAILPAGLTMRDNETILATEVYYKFEPLIFPFIPSTTVRRVSFFRPRIGALQEMKP